jgi:hypothetical protein
MLKTLILSACIQGGECHFFKVAENLRPEVCMEESQRSVVLNVESRPDIPQNIMYGKLMCVSDESAEKLPRAIVPDNSI